VVHKNQPSASRGFELEFSSGLSHDAIRTQLNRIFLSREFHATDRIRDFLRFVVEETLAGRADQLKGYTIATQVFGRDKDFDGALDPVVRIQAGRLRRAMERYYLVAGESDPVFIDIPKGSYIPVFSEKAAAAELLGAGAAEGSLSHTPVGPTVAVMPLENLTPGSDEGFFTVGLAEELVTELNRFQDIVVIPCQRAMQGAGSPAGLERLCHSVGARFMLGGTIRRDEETAKVSMRLIDAKTKRQSWAKAFKHSLEASSLIRTQEEIARSVVATIASDHGVISQRLAAESRKKSPDELSTYEAMLRYHSYMIEPSPGASEACFAALRGAVEREPEYGPTWSALATLYCQMYVFDVPEFDEPLETGLDYARRGVFLEPGRQLSRLILTYAYLLNDQLDAFKSEAETTLALNSNNPYAVGTLGYMYVLSGEFERGRLLLDRATAANPFHPSWFKDAYYLDHFHHGDFQKAYETVKSREESIFWQSTLAAAVLGKLGREDEAAMHAARLIERKPDFCARARELLGRSIKVPSLVEELLDGLRRAGLAIGGD
jgi:adenylate cyclase